MPDDGKNDDGNNNTNEQQEIEDFDLIDSTSDEFVDFDVKDPGMTYATDFIEIPDDGIDAQSSPSSFRCRKPNDENL